MNLGSHWFSKLATKIFALKVYLKFKKVVLIILSTHGKPNLNMPKNLFKSSYIDSEK